MIYDLAVMEDTERDPRRRQVKSMIYLGELAQRQDPLLGVVRQLDDETLATLTGDPRLRHVPHPDVIALLMRPPTVHEPGSSRWKIRFNFNFLGILRMKLRMDQ